MKAYRADWDGTLQPYALYVPRDVQARGVRAGGRWSWRCTARTPITATTCGACSGWTTGRGENDAEASRNELPLPDVPALVVSPFGRGELMGYDGLGGDDVMRVIADVRRAYDIDPDRISLTGLSMGGGGTWQIGLRHPELFAALAPVCGVADPTRWIPPAGRRASTTSRALERESPLALADNAARMQVFIFHGAKDTTVPVVRVAADGGALSGARHGWTRTSATPNTPTSLTPPGGRRTRTRRCCERWPAIKRDPAALEARRRRRRCWAAVPGLFGKRHPAPAAAHLRLRQQGRARRRSRRRARSRPRWRTGGRWSARASRSRRTAM